MTNLSTVTRIESIEDPRLDIFRSLKKTNQSRDHDVFVAEGVTVVERLLKSNFDVQSVLVTEQKVESFRECISAGVTFYALSRELASTLVGYTFHMGVLAAAHRPKAPSLKEVLPSIGPSLVFVADHVIDQQNVGLLIRIASGFGANALLLTKGSADAFSRRAIRVSTGNGFSLPIVDGIVPDGEWMQELKRLGYSVCATVLSKEAVELRAFEFPKRTAIVFGNETHGIRKSIITNCDHRLTISMRNDTDSVNVALAAGIFGYAYQCANLR